MEKIEYDPIIISKLNRKRMRSGSYKSQWLIECVFSEVLPDLQLIEEMNLTSYDKDVLLRMYLFPMQIDIQINYDTDTGGYQGALTYRQFVVLHFIVQSMNKRRHYIMPFINYDPSFWYYYNMIKLEKSGDIIRYINVPKRQIASLKNGDALPSYAAVCFPSSDVGDFYDHFGVMLGENFSEGNVLVEGSSDVLTGPFDITLGNLKITQESYFIAKVFWDFIYSLKYKTSRLVEAKSAIEQARPYMTYIGDQMAQNFLNNTYEEEPYETRNGLPSFMAEAMEENELDEYAGMTSEERYYAKKEQRMKMIARFQVIDDARANGTLDEWAKEHGYDRPICRSDLHTSSCVQGCSCCREVVAARLAKDYAPYEWSKALNHFLVPEYEDNTDVYTVDSYVPVIDGIVSKKTGVLVNVEGVYNSDNKQEFLEDDYDERDQLANGYFSILFDEHGRSEESDCDDDGEGETSSDRDQKKEALSFVCDNECLLARVIDALPKARDVVLANNLLIHPEVWNSYLNIDSFVASHVHPDFYKEFVSDPQLLEFSGPEMLQNNYERMPSTFRKFAHLLNKIGWIEFDEKGCLILDHVESETQACAMEISASPYGCANLFLSQKLVEKYYYSVYAGEKEQIEYKPGENVSENFMPVGESTDVYNVVSFLLSNRCQLSPIDYIIIDIPLHRNSLYFYTGSQHPGGKAKELAEFVDDMPLGKSQAQHDLIRLMGPLLQSKLKSGGKFLFKVLDLLRLDVINSFYEMIARFFSKSSFVINPLSKDLSKEIYFVGEGFSPGLQNDRKGKLKFFKAVGFVNNRLYSQLARRLIMTSLLYGKRHTAFNKVGCRNKLRLKNCIPTLPNFITLKTWADYRLFKNKVSNM